MELVWIVIVIVAAGFIGARFVFAKERLPATIRDIFLTGWEFVLLGAMVGPLGFDLVTYETLGQLNPPLAMVLGWAGLIFGLQLRRDDLLKVDPALLKVTIFQATLTWWGLFVPVFLALLFPFGIQTAFCTAAVIAAASSLSSPTALAAMAPRFSRKVRGGLRKLHIITSLDLGPAMVGVGVVFCFFPAQSGGLFNAMAGVSLLAYSALLALAMAGLFRFIGRQALRPEEHLTLLIGFLVFISGVAFYLNLSPIFLGLLVGVTLANTIRADDPVYSLLYSSEKPFYVILLLLTGMWWHPAGPMIAVAGCALFLWRLWLKSRGAELGGRRYLGHDPLPTGAGLALGAQGALSLAIGLNYVIIYPGRASEIAFALIALTTVLGEILAPFLIHRVFGGYAEEGE